jgi:hypothetical protein
VRFSIGGGHSQSWSFYRSHEELTGGEVKGGEGRGHEGRALGGGMERGRPEGATKGLLSLLVPAAVLRALCFMLVPALSCVLFVSC